MAPDPINHDHDHDHGTPLGLTPEHLADLRRSGLTDATIRENGIRSEHDAVRVREILGGNLSASAARRLGPCLVIPFFDPTGAAVTYRTPTGTTRAFVRLKPSQPRKAANGKPIKYESPRGSGNSAFVPAGSRAAVLDPKQPVMLIEGEKKALAATQYGFTAIAISGTWNWTERRPEDPDTGRKTGPFQLIKDLARIPWRERIVYIAFDSDTAQKPAIQWALYHLAEALTRGGADVRVIALPSGPNGEKVGLDDFLVAHGRKRLLDLIDAAGPAVRPTQVGARKVQHTESGYAVINGYTCRRIRTRATGTGEPSDEFIRLANFHATIDAETVRDDGAERTREFTITIRQGNRVTTASVPVEQFAAMDWVVERFGPRCVIQAGRGTRDHLRCAIQELSGENIRTTTVYGHTGWRHLDGSWYYLHAGGAIGPPGAAVPRLDVRLDGAAEQFLLPVPPQGADLRDAILASLGLLDGLAPDRITIPLVASLYRAALGSPDFALWFIGRTGVQKSELAALAQQHYGAAMTRGQLPANWSSTDNALEGLAFACKDTVMVVDDFAPSQSRSEIDRQHRTAERVIRGQGNHAGRQRMRSDTTLRPPRPPRGLIVATGEDVPRGHSIAARLCVVDVRRGDVNLTGLTRCQEDALAGKYAAAMAGFIAWLSSQYATVSADLGRERVALRNAFVGFGNHARTPDVIANLLIGFRYFLDFAVAHQAIDGDQRTSLWERGMAVVRELGDQLGDHQWEVDPIRNFPLMVRSILSGGRGHVAGMDGRVPLSRITPEFWGWKACDPLATTARGIDSYRSCGDTIGWIDGEELYLNSDTTYAAINELTRDQNQAFPLTQITLCKHLKDEGLLLRYEEGRTRYPMTIGGTRQRVLVVSVSTIYGESGTDRARERVVTVEGP
ncbi:DUF3854 domain-containing protein [Limnoglobus roseus]|uniref:DUF3854 domain-containing protein n=1 Tax=Limnoglobus roseus TaxID=2598579 RepID=A0A5C1ALV5_9BACT|nr:DUF3854 domain-containing protein [Limnoglobus roseus]QEL19167.1 hypothetical protein PX52LOC_06225 [Limnoglobus roseus]